MTLEVAEAAIMIGNNNGSAPGQTSDADSQARQASNGEQARQAAVNAAQALGQTVWLMTRSIAHRHVFIADLEWMVIPAIELGQFRLFRRDSMPVAFASWALVSEETEQRLAQGTARLAPNEWRSGDRLWLVELLAPFGNTDLILEELKKTAFSGRSFKLHRRGPDGVPRIESLHGIQAAATQLESDLKSS